MTFIIVDCCRDFSTMLTDPDFVLLLISFSLQVGMSWALASVIGQLVQPCGYADNLVGQALLITATAGTIGSFCLAYVLRSNHHNYFFIYKLLIVSTMMMCMICFSVNKPGGPYLVLMSWMLYGLSTGPLTPVALELAAEMTYPIPADNSATLLFCVAIGVYFLCTVMLTPLLHIDVSVHCYSIVTPASITVILLSIIGTSIAIPMKPLFKRKDMAAKERANRNITAIL